MSSKAGEERHKRCYQDAFASTLQGKATGQSKQLGRAIGQSALTGRSEGEDDALAILEDLIV